MSERVLSVESEVVPDPDPDVSYLDPDPTDSPEQVARKRSRLNAMENGHWLPVGVRATAVIAIPLDQDAIVTQAITTPGVWGIESDDATAIRHAQEAEDDVLTRMLDALGCART